MNPSKESQNLSDLENCYRQKQKTAAELVSMLPDGAHFWIDIALSQPKTIFEAIEQNMDCIKDRRLTFHTMLDLYPMPWCREDAPDGLGGVTWFSSGGAAAAVNAGIADVMPCYYRDIPSLIEQNPQINAVCLSVSPMDQHGYFSMGCTTSASAGLLERAEYIFLEVNRQVPRSLYSPLIHISQVTALCESDYPLPLAKETVLDETSSAIGAYIAEEIPDGATIQLGIGAIPDAVGIALKEKKHLGIHTEMFGDSMVELIECGAVDNTRKPIHRGHSVTTFAYGSKRVYDYINDNPAMEVLPVNYVNNPQVIAQHPNFISVNAAVEVDFFGQVCAESIGTRHVSGSGGQVDYVRGAVMSPGGKSFIAFPSTAAKGSVSRICSTLSEGAAVTTSKNDVDHIVTEYGVAKLRGKTLSQRTKALIAIAHPKFREELTFEAKKRNILI